METPLNALSEKELCPGSAALDKINASLRSRKDDSLSIVMPALVAGIHVFSRGETWMAGTSPAMTKAKQSQPYPGRRLLASLRCSQ